MTITRSPSLQNCHPGRDRPGDPVRVEASWTGMDAVAPCTRMSQRAKLSWGLAGEQARVLGTLQSLLSALVPHSSSPPSSWHCQCQRNAGSCSTAITHMHAPALLSTTFVPGSLSCQTSPIAKITTIKSNPTSCPTFPHSPSPHSNSLPRNKRPRAGESGG